MLHWCVLSSIKSCGLYQILQPILPIYTNRSYLTFVCASNALVLPLSSALPIYIFNVTLIFSYSDDRYRINCLSARVTTTLAMHNRFYFLLSLYEPQLTPIQGKLEFVHISGANHNRCASPKKPRDAICRYYNAGQDCGALSAYPEGQAEPAKLRETTYYPPEGARGHLPVRLNVLHCLSVMSGFLTTSQVRC